MMTPARPTTIIERERRKRRYFGVLAAIGVVVLLIELALNWIRNDPIEWMPVLIGVVIGFAGFSGLDYKKAHAVGDFIVDSALNIILVLRTGRRATDVVTVQVCKSCGKSEVFCECPEAEDPAPGGAGTPGGTDVAS